MIWLKHYLFSMPLQVVTLCQHSITEGRKQPGQHGKHTEVIDAFLALAVAPLSIDDQTLSILERYVVLLYDRGSNKDTVYMARKDLFTRKGREIEHIPPSQAALLQHTKRAAYQAGHIWGQTLIANPELPTPSDWGYKKTPSGEWQPVWTFLPQAATACRELKRYGCKSGC